MSGDISSRCNLFVGVSRRSSMNIFLLAGAVAQSLQVTVVPAQPLLERTLYGQAMNCDFRIANRGSEELELRVVASRRTRPRTGRSSRSWSSTTTASRPASTIVPNRKLAAGGGITLFNPFHTLAAQWPLASLEYTFRFGDEKDGDVVQSVRVTAEGVRNSHAAAVAARRPVARLGRS